MNTLEAWRRALKPLIPRGFLRRDQGGGLLVSDYPRHRDAAAVTARILATGFTVDISGEIAFIDGDLTRYRALDGLPPPPPVSPTDDTLFLYSLARRLEKTGAPFREDALPCYRAVLKALDAKDQSGLYRLLAPAAALAQRRGAPLPAALGKIILYAWSKPQAPQKPYIAGGRTDDSHAE